MTKLYVPWLNTSEPTSVASGRAAHVYGGDENPLLRGGIATASFALEYLATGNAEALDAALELFGYAERSEYVTPDGVSTGFFLRTRWLGDVHDQSGRPTFHASGDELSGLMLGLFWLNRALVQKARTRTDDVARVQGLANRLGRQLQGNHFFIVPPDGLGARPVRQAGWAAMFAFRWFAGRSPARHHR